MPKQRNPFACSPIMRKGGVHRQSKTGQRRSNKNKLLDEVDEYLDELEQTQKNRIIGKPDDSANKITYYFNFS